MLAGQHAGRQPGRLEREHGSAITEVAVEVCAELAGELTSHHRARWSILRAGFAVSYLGC